MSLDRTPLETDLGGRYRLERELGSGGMSTVYLAFDEKRGSRVALKVLLPELASALGADRFLREIRIASKLGHPHILPLYDWGQAGERLYYTMPYQEAETLRARLDREGQLGIEASLEIAKQVAGALHHAHGQGVVHRDIKPENILLTEGGAVVMDFGIARAIDRAGGERLTETGLAMGTPAYMSPEQAEGRERVDGRSDQYSLACVLYEMLAGHPPFGGPTSQVVLSRAANDPVPPLSNARRTVSVPVEAVIHKALSKVAADRFASAEELGKALELAEQGVTPRGVTPSSVTTGGITPWSVPYRTTVWTELARRRVYQVAVSYLVVAWALVQVADATFESLGLPATAQTWLIWGLIGGFPIAVVMAWLYELTPRGIRRTRAVGVTPDTGTRPAQRPRLALTVGVAAVGVTGVLAFLAGQRSTPPPAVPTEIAPFPIDANYHAKAVIPFRVSEGLEQYRTALVDLLLPRFNNRSSELEAAGIRRAWREIAGPDSADVDLLTARRIARHVGAPWMVHGSLLEAPTGLTLSAGLVWVETGKEYKSATIETSEDDLTRALAMVPAKLLGEAPQHILDETPTAAIEAYAEGLAAMPDFVASIPHFERALQIDPTFGSAAYKLFYAYHNSGRRDTPPWEAARQTAWALRDRLAVAESLFQVVDGNFGPNGPGNPGVSRRESLALLEEMTADDDAHWGIWSVYMGRMQSWGRQLELPRWRTRALNAANRTLEEMPPTEGIAPWVLWMRYELAAESEDVSPDSLAKWEREWVFGYHHGPEVWLSDKWSYAARREDWDAARDLLPDIASQNMLWGPQSEGRIVDNFVDNSARRGHPLDLGAEQAVAAAESRVTTEDDRRVAVHAQARLALLQGRLREAAAKYDSLQSIGETSWRWLARWGGAFAALADPALRNSGVDFGAPFFAVLDTAPVPRFVESWDNPVGRLCMRDLWEVVVRQDYSRPSKEAARLETQSWPSGEHPEGEPALPWYERGYCEAIANAVVDEAAATGETLSPGLSQLLRYEPSQAYGTKLAALFAARLLAERGQYAQALAALGPFPTGGGPSLVPEILAYLVLEGTLAAETGDKERATRAFEHYLTLRTNPDELARPEVDAVCAELRTVAGAEAAERFATCR